MNDVRLGGDSLAPVHNPLIKALNDSTMILH